jgi:hypothetical protein
MSVPAIIPVVPLTQLPPVVPLTQLQKTLAAKKRFFEEKKISWNKINNLKMGDNVEMYVRCPKYVRSYPDDSVIKYEQYPTEAQVINITKQPVGQIIQVKLLRDVEVMIVPEGKSSIMGEYNAEDKMTIPNGKIIDLFVAEIKNWCAKCNRYKYCDDKEDLPWRSPFVFVQSNIRYCEKYSCFREDNSRHYIYYCMKL